MNDTPINPSLEANRCPTHEEQIRADIREYTQIRDTLNGIIARLSKDLARVRPEAKLTVERVLNCPVCQKPTRRLYVDGSLPDCCEYCLEPEDEAWPSVIGVGR